MPDADAPLPGDPADLQFDRADFGEERAGTVTCAFCRQGIADHYYEINQQVACERCRDGVLHHFASGRGFRGFLKAGLYGFAAAIGGAIIIYLIREMTGADWALVSILAGYMVGSAARQGSGYLGGRSYQILAVLLTYSALSWSYLPILTKDFMQRAREARHADGVAAEKKGGETEKTTAVDKEARSTEAPVAAKADNASDESEKPAQVAAAAPVDPEKADEKPAKGPDDGPAEPRPHVGLLLLYLALLSGFLLAASYVLPILGNLHAMPEGLIGLFILFVGLYQAWRLTQRAEVTFRGPFLVKADQPPRPRVFDNG